MKARMLVLTALPGLAVVIGQVYGLHSLNESFKLTASDAAPGDEFGISVAISGDTAIVRAYLDDDAGENSGSAYLFSWSAWSTWRPTSIS